MSFTITDAMKAEIMRPHPRFVRQGILYKNFYNATTRVAFDVSSRIESWGRLVVSSSITAVNMEKPGLTFQAQNSDDYLNPYFSTSWWKTSPSVDPKECVYVFDLYVLTGVAGVRAQVLKYTGRVIDFNIIREDSTDIIEIETIAESTVYTKLTLPKSYGGSVELPYNTY